MRWVASRTTRRAKEAFEQIAGPRFAPAAVVDEKPPERVYTKYGIPWRAAARPG